MDLCACVSDDCGHGEGVGTYPTLVVEKFQDDDTGCPRVVRVGVMKMWMEVLMDVGSGRIHPLMRKYICVHRRVGE